MIIAIDLAIYKSGYCILTDDNIIFDYGTIQSVNGSASNVDKIMRDGNAFVNTVYMNYQGQNDKGLKIVIELSNFGNPSNTNRYGFIAGVIHCLFSFKFKNIEFKYINANDGFKEMNIINGHTLPRDLRKKISIDKAAELASSKQLTEDEADAINMAFLYDRLVNNSELQEFNKYTKHIKKAAKVSKQKMLLKLKEKIVKLKSEMSSYEVKEKLNALTKAQVNKLLKMRQKLAELNEQLKEYK